MKSKRTALVAAFVIAMNLSDISVFADDGTILSNTTGQSINISTSQAIEVNGNSTTGSAIEIRDDIKKPENPAISEKVFSPSTKFKGSVVKGDMSRYTYSQLQNDIKKMGIEYKGFLTAEVIGKSTFGRNINLIHFGNPSAKKKILIMGSLHGREGMNTPLIMKQIEYYVQNFYKPVVGKLRPFDVFNQVSIDIIPMFNPDGVSISQFGLSGVPGKYRAMVLKLNKGKRDFKTWKANGRGINLNRNFPTRWEMQHDVAKSAGPTGYPGVAPATEVETKIFMNLVMKEKYEGFISYHSMGQIVYWYEEQTGTALKISKDIATKICNITGYKIDPAKDGSEFGTATAWFEDYTKRPGITIENGKVACPLPASQFPAIWNKTKNISLLFALWTKDIGKQLDANHFK